MKGMKIIVTYKCNMICECCEFKCAPYKKGFMGIKEFDSKVNSSFQEGFVDYVNIAGGEPFLNSGVLFKYFKAMTNIKTKKIITSNGYWGEIEPFTHIISDLKKLGLNEIIIEYDYFHSKYIDRKTIKEAISKCFLCGIDVSIKSTFNTKKLDCSEDIITYEAVKDIKREFNNIRLIFVSRGQNCNPVINNEKMIFYKA